MNRIKELRKKHGLTLKELGHALDMPNNTISQYENGKRNPKIEVWQKIAGYFDVSVPYLQGKNVIRVVQWNCYECKRSFFVTNMPLCCPYCDSTEIDSIERGTVYAQSN